MKFIIATLLIIGLPLIIVLSHLFLPSHYLLSSLYKLVFLVPLIYRMVVEKNSFWKALTRFVDLKKVHIHILFVGSAFILLYIGGYLFFAKFIDTSAIASGLGQTGITSFNFVGISLYIIFVNSFLEEFFWRGFVFEMLRKQSRFHAYLISSTGFALFHAAFSIHFLDWNMFLLSTAGLALFALLMNLHFERYKNLADVWIIHACTDIPHIIVGLFALGVFH